MIENLDHVCNKSPLVLLYGSNVSNATRHMLQLVRGEHTFSQVTYYDSKRVESEREHFAQTQGLSSTTVSNVRKINLMSLSVYNYAKSKFNPTQQNSYWVWCDGPVAVDTKESFDVVVQVQSGRIVNVSCKEIEMTYDDTRADNLGRWYSLVMSLYYDVLDRLSFHNLALFLTNVYSFVEYSCANKGQPKNISTAKKTLGIRYSETVGSLFELRLLFATEPFNREDIWDLMLKILNDDMFYELLQIHFMQSYSELVYLKQLSHLAAIEKSKEGL